MEADSGLQFDFSYGEGTSWEQMLAFETAGMMWSDYISDDMTVNIHVEMTDTLPDNVIGGALPGMVADVNYTEFRNAYQNDITTWRDQRNFDSLSILREGSGGIGPGGTWEKFEARIDFGGDHFIEDSGELNMTRANAKALGLISGNDAGLDGYIKMNKLSNSSLEWDYSRDWTPKNTLDFLSTAVHEVGHVLGFVSGVDKYEGVKFSDIDAFWNHFGTYDAFKDFTNDVLDHANPLDLFRYSSESLAINNGRNTIDMSIGTQAFFGPAQLWDAFATGKETSIDGDGFQASHWRYSDNNSNIQGIMDPLMQPGVIRQISNRDLRAMDAIGYSVTSRGNELLDLDAKLGVWKPMTAAGTDIGTEMGTLQWRAKDHLAKSLYNNGEASWVNWWMQNAPGYSSALTRDRSWEIDNMIDKSQVYEGRRSRSGSSRSYSRQEIFFAESYFSSIDAKYFNAAPASGSDMSSTLKPVVEVDESESNTNLLARDEVTLPVDNRDNAVVSTVEMNLISLTEEDAANSDNTISTKMNRELTTDFSLYTDSSATSNSAMILA